MAGDQSAAAPDNVPPGAVSRETSRAIYADALKAHDGPEFRHWRNRLAASVGGVLLDDLQERA